MSLLTMRQYAKHRGVSHETVSNAVKKGRITCVRNERGYAQIDPEVADREWSENSDHAKMISKGQTPQAPSQPEADGPRGPSYAQSRAIREAYQARLAKLDYDERMGKLVEAEEVKRKWVQVAGLVRTKVLGIPSMAKQRIPDLTSEQYLVIEAIVREALEALADGND